MLKETFSVIFKHRVRALKLTTAILKGLKIIQWLQRHIDYQCLKKFKMISTLFMK